MENTQRRTQPGSAALHLQAKQTDGSLGRPGLSARGDWIRAQVLVSDASESESKNPRIPKIILQKRKLNDF